MFDAVTNNAENQRNLVSWSSLVLALITVFIWIYEVTITVPYIVMLRTGPTAILGLVLGIMGVLKSKSLHTGRGIGITGIVICALFVLQFFIGLSVAMTNLGH